MSENNANEKLQRNLIENRIDACVFTTGAFLIPAKLENGKWAWVVSAFEDSTFFEGEDVNVEALWVENPQDLIGRWEEEE